MCYDVAAVQKELQECIEFYKTCKNDIPSIIQVCREFDGKVVNKKMATRIHDVTKSHTILKLKDRCDENYIEISSYGKGNKYYIFVCLSQYDKNYNSVFTETDTGKRRLNAENLIKIINKHNDILDNNIKSISASIPKIQDYVNTYNKMIDDTEKFVKSLPFDVCDSIQKNYLCNSLIYKLR